MRFRAVKLTKMSKYELKIIKSDKVFWTKNSVDKPSYNWFYYTFLRDSGWKNIGSATPNWKNEFNAQIVLDDDKYNYLRINDTETNEVFYYFVESVDKRLSKGYVMNITMDVFATYCYKFLNDTLIYQPLKINRTSFSPLHLLDEAAYYQQDPLIDVNCYPVENIDVKYNDVFNEDGKMNTIYCNGMPCVKGSKLTNDNSYFVWGSGWNGNTNLTLNNRIDSQGGRIFTVNQAIFCDVFIENNGTLLFVPIWTEKNRDQFEQIGLNIFFQCWGEPDRTSFCMNNETNVNYFKNSKDFVSKYKGRFLVPFFILFMKYCSCWTICDFVRDGSVYYILILEQNKNYQTIGSDNYWYTDNVAIYADLTFDWRTNQTITRNPSIYLLSKTCQIDDSTPLLYFGNFNNMNQFYFGSFAKNPKTDFLCSFYFDNTNGFKWISNVLDIGIGCEIHGGSTLPVSIDNYQTYLASVSSSQAASLAQAKQEQIMSTTKSAFSGLMGIGSAIMSGNIMGGISAAGNAIFGGVNAHLQYENHKKSIDAKNADAARTAGANQIIPANQKDNFKNLYALNKKLVYVTMPNFIKLIKLENHDNLVVKTLKPIASCSKYQYYLMKFLNKIVWESGYYIEKNHVFNTFLIDNNLYNTTFFEDRINNFIYWDIQVNDDYINVFLPFLNKNVQKAISICLNQPFRFWKNSKPNYSIDLVYSSNPKVDYGD